MPHERPSPFTIPEPVFKFAEGAPSEAPPARSMSVEGLIHNLTLFADFYEQASGAIESADVFEKTYHRSGRDANSDYYQRCFRATPGIDRVRAYSLAQFGEDLTLSTARRLLGGLIRVHKLSVEAAGELSLEAAMDRLEPSDTAGRAEAKPAAPSNASLLEQAKQFLTDKDREEEARQVAMKLLPYVFFGPDWPHAVSPGTRSATPTAEANPPVTAPQFVNLDQMAAMVNRSKATLERRLNTGNSTMPRPDVEGGGGKPHEWRWDRIRPWLMAEFGRDLPERFPNIR